MVVVVWLLWCSCCGVVVVVWLVWCGCCGVVVVVWLMWCGCVCVVFGFGDGSEVCVGGSYSSNDFMVILKLNMKRKTSYLFLYTAQMYQRMKLLHTTHTT